MTGKFIVLYGINNLGKTTQAKLLANYLRKLGKRVKLVKYPVYNLKPSGPFINEYLRDNQHQQITPEELQMWYALNRLQFQPKLRRWLGQGFWVVAEDYKGTGIAWGGAYGVDLVWLEAINATQLEPDVSILLDGKRFADAAEKNHRHEIDHKLINRCRTIHRQLAKKYGWHVVNANQTIEKVRQDIVRLVQ